MNCYLEIIKSLNMPYMSQFSEKICHNHAQFKEIACRSRRINAKKFYIQMYNS